MVVADAEQAILAPSIRARSSVVVRERLPGLAVGRIVLTHGSPLTLGQVWAPAPPRCAVLSGVGLPLALGSRRYFHRVVAIRRRRHFAVRRWLACHGWTVSASVVR